MSKNKEVVEWMRDIVTAYDEGLLTAGEVGARLFRRELDAILEHVRAYDAEDPEKKEGLMLVSSWCGPKPPPPEIVRIEIEVGASCIAIRPLGP